ncbi:hypothetical protein BH10ACT3_BH10ACT3_07040 [soil metagenome]
MSLDELSTLVDETGATVADDSVDAAAADLVVEELLVEEVSIDGMCGVY